MHMNMYSSTALLAQTHTDLRDRVVLVAAAGSSSGSGSCCVTTSSNQVITDS